MSIRSALCVLATLCSGTVSVALATASPPDLILWNGHVVTVNSTDDVAQAVAVRDGRIVAVGTNATVRALAGAHTQIIDLRGYTATPGLIDAHAHIASGGLASVTGVDLSKARSISEVTQLIAARAKQLPAGAWVLGSGWDEAKLKEHRYLESRDLDPVSGDHPVWLDQTTGHYGTANSVAMSLAKIDRESRDPPAGTIVRDASGQPSGVLKESARDGLLALIPPPSDTDRRQGILASLAVMAREGMTGVKDPSIREDDWRAYRSLAATHQLSAHVCVLWGGGSTLAEADNLITRLHDLPRPSPQDDLTSCGVKLFMDGSGGGRTAWMYDDWNLKSVGVDSGNRGYPLIEPETYRQMVSRFNSAGIPIGTHAIGDRAIDWVVDSYAAALQEHPIEHLRHSIIHANVPTDHALETMADLQRRYDAGIPEAQGPFTWWIGDNYAGNFGPDRAKRLNPFATYRARGIRWAGGSDYDVTPLPARFGLWASVARQTLQGTYGHRPFGTAESVDIKTALRSYTTWAARQLYIDNETGTLEIGKSADIAIWQQNMLSIPDAQLKDLHCALTLYRGRVVFSDGTLTRRQ
jgi:predicted amidohydrolase YtcJ